jgi:hypothetical protein
MDRGDERKPCKYSKWVMDVLLFIRFIIRAVEAEIIAI